MNRKTFLKKTATAMLVAIPAYTLVSCSSSDDSDDGGQGGAKKSCVDNGTSSSIDSNHGHSMTVSKADVTAGTEKTYEIKGTSAHPHSVTVTAANFTTLKGNNSVTVTSSADAGHTHSVTISCA